MDKIESQTVTPSHFPNFKVLMVGATGAVGKQLLKILMESPQVTKITTFGRKKHPDYPQDNEKLTQIVMETLDKLEEHKEKFVNHDVAYCCLGTTRKDAGSAEAFRKVDYGYVFKFAELCKEASVSYFHLVSSTGANANSWFLYPKTKGQIEEAVKGLKFPKTSIYRPPLLERKEDARFVEKIFAPILTSMDVAIAARAMFNNTLKNLQSQEQIVETLDSTKMKNLAK